MNNEEKQVRFFDYIEILVKWKRFIGINVLIVAMLSVLVSFLLPKWYKSTASVLPPKDQGFLNLFGATSSVLKGLGSLSKLSGLGQNTGQYNHFAILKSRSTMEAVVKKFDLINVYDISDSSMENTIKALKDNVSFESQDEDYISLEVYDKNPQRAADIANYFVDILNRRSIELGTLEAKSNREFIEKRLQSAKDSLRQAEESLRRLQERSGIILTPDQTTSMSSIAELYAMKAKKEIEVAILEREVTPENDALQQLRIELGEVDKKLSSMPQKGLEAFRLYREVVTQQKIIEFIIPLFEQAKVNEQKNIPVILVLDKAIPAEHKVRPQRGLIIFSITTVFFLLFIVLAFAMQGIIQKGLQSKPIDKKLLETVNWVISRYRVNLS